jgi:multiple sugar transport system permease protein
VVPAATNRGVRRRSLAGYAFVAPAVVFLATVGAYPLLYTAYLSLTTLDEGKFSFAGLRQYAALATDATLWAAVGNTLVFTIGSTVLHLVLGLGFALLLNEVWFSTRVRNLFRGLLILPYVFSTASAALMWSLLLHPFGLFNFARSLVAPGSAPVEFLGTPGVAMVSIIVVDAWKAFPFYMIMLLGGLQSVDVDLYEAASTDGAGPGRRFVHITLPHIRPLIAILAMIEIITTVGHVDLVKLLTEGGPLETTQIVGYYIYKTALLNGEPSYGAAISTSMLVVVGILMIFYVRMTLQADADA